MYESFSIIQDRCPNINLPIVLNEGGAKNRLWRRMITDIFNVPTVFLKSRIGAPDGRRHFGRCGDRNLQGFLYCEEKAEYIDRMDPIPANHDRYMDYHELYRRLYCISRRICDARKAPRATSASFSLRHSPAF